MDIRKDLLNIEALDNHILGTNDVNAPFNQPELDFISECCGALPFGELDDYGADEPLGLCTRCKEHSTFYLESDEEDIG